MYISGIGTQHKSLLYARGRPYRLLDITTSSPPSFFHSDDWEEPTPFLLTPFLLSTVLGKTADDIEPSDIDDD
ncbi:hypothetical protein TNCV_1446861 [Trichonephila clavipes]|nr:hypothetical protein TNCV_1446861 [Trichonephila clavipes]